MMDLFDKKMRLVWMYNAIQEQIDTYWLDDISIDEWPFKEICEKKQEIEQELKEINRLLAEQGF